MRLSFSLDGDRISNWARKFKGGENSFDLVWRNLKKFRDFAGEPPLVKMTVLPSNVARLYANVKFLTENGFYKIWPNPGVFKVKWKKKDVDVFSRQYEKVLKFYLKNRLSHRPINLVPVDDILMNAGKGALKEKDFFCGLGEEPILSFDGNIYTCDSVLLGVDRLIDRFKVGGVVDNKVNIDLNKMRFFQKYSILEEYDLRHKDHSLAHLFRRRPCFAIGAKGEALKKEYIENILEIHVTMYELSVDLFNTYKHLLQ